MLQTIAERQRYLQIIKPVLADLINETLVTLQVTEEDLELWLHDPNAYLASQEEELQTYTVRSVSYGLLEVYRISSFWFFRSEFVDKHVLRNVLLDTRREILYGCFATPSASCASSVTISRTVEAERISGMVEIT